MLVDGFVAKNWQLKQVWIVRRRGGCIRPAIDHTADRKTVLLVVNRCRGLIHHARLHRSCCKWIDWHTHGAHVHAVFWRLVFGFEEVLDFFNNRHDEPSLET